MLTANRLEKIMELEEQLRDQYQEQIDAKTREIEALKAEKEAVAAEMQATIDKQLESIKDLSGKSQVSERVEQQNRELTNRSEKQAAEISELKKRVKTLQRDLAAVRDENKVLNQFDPPRMKKNLAANKKKLAEQTKANDLLQKSVNQTRKENLELQRKVEELEARLAELEPAETDAGTETAGQEEQAAA